MYGFEVQKIGRVELISKEREEEKKKALREVLFISLLNLRKYICLFFVSLCARICVYILFIVNILFCIFCLALRYFFNYFFNKYELDCIVFLFHI